MFFTTGIDTGFANDVLPLALSGISRNIDTIRLTEMVNYATRMHDDIAPDWPQPGVAIAPQDLGYGGASGRGAYRVEIEGSPNIRCECDSRGDRRYGWCVARWPVHTGCDWSGTWMGVSSDDIDSLQADYGRSPATGPNPRRRAAHCPSQIRGSA
jgi:hypothetical protein